MLHKVESKVMVGLWRFEAVIVADIEVDIEIDIEIDTEVLQRIVRSNFFPEEFEVLQSISVGSKLELWEEARSNR